MSEELSRTLADMSDEELVRRYYEAYEGSLVREAIRVWCNMSGRDFDEIVKEYPEWQI